MKSWASSKSNWQSRIPCHCVKMGFWRVHFTPIYTSVLLQETLYTTWIEGTYFTPLLLQFLQFTSLCIPFLSAYKQCIEGSFEFRRPFASRRPDALASSASVASSASSASSCEWFLTKLLMSMAPSFRLPRVISSRQVLRRYQGFCFRVVADCVASFATNRVSEFPWVRRKGNKLLTFPQSWHISFHASHDNRYSECKPTYQRLATMCIYSVK